MKTKITVTIKHGATWDHADLEDEIDMALKPLRERFPDTITSIDVRAEKPRKTFTREFLNMTIENHVEKHAPVLLINCRRESCVRRRKILAKAGVA